MGPPDPNTGQGDPVIKSTYSHIDIDENENVTSNTTNWLPDQTQSTSQTVTTGPSAEGSQDITNYGYVYRTPYYEAYAQYHRALISLMDEQFAELMRQDTLSAYGIVLINELNSIDRGIYLLQIAYLNTLLTSPIPGTVTGIYKQPGEAVMAGDTVVRVENNSQVYLIGTVVCPALIRPGYPNGMTATIDTSLYDAAGITTPSITATVLTARGGGVDDKWEITMLYNNDGTNGPILPLDYHFDFDDTKISLA
jgi:biotin carboxyl carrier protein